MTTRAEQKRLAFVHVTENILCFTQPTIQAFIAANVSDLTTLISISDAKLDSIQLSDNNNNPIPLPYNTKNNFINFYSYLNWLHSEGRSPGSQDWVNLLYEDFDDFCLGRHFSP